MSKSDAARRRRRRISGVVVPLSILLGSALVWGSSESAYTATTATGSNGWASGTVTLTNDQAAANVFSSLTLLQPDNTLTALTPPATGVYNATAAVNGGSHCIEVTYTGSLNGEIHMYASQSGSLPAAMLFTVDKGTDTATPGSDVNCSTYTSSSYVYGSSGTTTNFLSAFPTTFGSLGAAGAWTVIGGSTNTQWYRISWLLPKGTSNATTGQTATATFTWEVQST